MPSPKNGAAIIYGKIQIIGAQGDTIPDCRKELLHVLKQAGYPEEEKDEEYDFEEEDTDTSEDDVNEGERRREEEVSRVQNKIPWNSIIKNDEEKE